MDEHFTCEECRTTGHIRYLHHRHTMPGDYCKTCAALEKCAACGEMEPVDAMEWKGSGNRLLCRPCAGQTLCDVRQKAQIQMSHIAYRKTA